MRSLITGLLVTFLLLTPGMGIAQTEKTSVEKLLLSVTERNWQQWSRGDGSITFQELADCMANPAYRGEDAAVLAGLTQYFLDVKPTKEKLTKQDIDNLLVSNVRLQKDCLDNLCNLYQNNSDLYANGEPTFSAVSQGKISNCFLVSALGWLALHRDNEIKQAIRPVENGYEVHFPSQHIVNVSPPTQAEIVFNNTYAGSDGLWVTVLQKAFGDRYSPYSPFQDKIEPTLNTSDRGFAAYIQHIWTGKTALCYIVKPENRNLIRDKLITIAQNKQLAQTGVMNITDDMPIVPGLGYGHAYAVLDFNPITNYLTLWNPWANNFVPAGKDGLTYGYLTHGGVFKIHLDEFLKVFCELIYEGEETVILPFMEVEK